MRARLEIAVAGAGPAGLAAALYLHRLGHRVRIIERFETPRPLGSGLILQPTGLAVLIDLGLGGEIMARGQELDRLRGTDIDTGRVVLDVRYDALKGIGRGLGVHRATLFEVLYGAVFAAGIAIETSRTIARREDLGPCDLVVDALGAGSPLRPDGVRPLRYGALWATVPWVEAGFDRRALLQRYRRASTMVGVLPIGRDQAAFFWSVRGDDYAALRATGFNAWAAHLLRLWPEAGPHLSAIGDFEALTLARYAHHTMPVPAGDGIVHIGDSAHSTSPQLGQGANMALLDARALYLALRDANDLAAALGRYVRLRRWHVRLYQALSAAFTPFYQSDSVVLPWIRDVVVSNLARIPPAPQLLAAMVAGTLAVNPIQALGMSGQT